MGSLPRSLGQILSQREEREGGEGEIEREGPPGRAWERGSEWERSCKIHWCVSRLSAVGRILPMDRVYGSERALTVGQARDRPTHLVGSSPTGHPSYLGHSDSNGVALGQAQGSVKAAPLVRSQAARPEGSPQVGNVWTERPKSKGVGGGGGSGPGPYDLWAVLEGCGHQALCAIHAPGPPRDMECGGHAVREQGGLTSTDAPPDDLRCHSPEGVV